MNRFFLLIFLLIIQRTALAQPINWNLYSGIRGINTIVETGSGALVGVQPFLSYNESFVHLDSMTLTVSTDDGASWSYGGLTCYWINSLVSNSRTARLLVDSYILKQHQSIEEILISIDNGASWNQLPFTGDFPLNFMLSDDGKIYGVYVYDTLARYAGRLMQYGKREWKFIGRPVILSTNMFNDVVLDHSNTFFMATDYGTYYSADYGATWNRLTAFDSRPVSALYVDSENRIYAGTHPDNDFGTNGGLFVSSDTGKTWETMGLYGVWFSEITTDPAGIIYVATNSGIYRNVQGTTRWDDITPAGSNSGAIICSRSGSLLAWSSSWWGSSTGIFRSTDNGNTWSTNAILENDIFTLTSDDSSDIYAGTLGTGIYKTISGGINSWKETLLGSVCDYVYSFAHCGSDIFAATECGVFRTTDRGASWINISSSSFNYYVYSIGVTSSGELFAGTTCGLFRCACGDTVWHLSGPGTMKILQVSVDSRDNIYVLTDGDGVFLSTDNGVTWTVKCAARVDFLSLAVGGSGAVFIGEYGGISRSTDRGQTWQEIPIGPLDVFSFAFRGISTVYAATTDGVYYSSDNGSTWSPAGSTGLGESFVLSLTFDQKGDIFAGTYRGGVYKGSCMITPVQSSSVLPTSVRLEQNYPNPFNPQTAIRYAIPGSSHVKLVVYDVLGREVRTLVDEVQEAGVRSVSFNASEFSSGIYFYRLTAGKFTETKKMLVIR